MSAAQLVAQLAAAGTPPELLAAVAEQLFAGQTAQVAIDARRANDRDRKTRKSREVTGSHGNGRDRRGKPPAGSPKDNNQTPSLPPVDPNEASASLPIRQPISEAVGCWNENAAACGWPTINSLSPNRHKLLASRLREHGIDGWRAAIARARASHYLAGSDPPSWFTFSWIIKAENFLKLTEGNYDRRHSDNADPTTVALVRVQEHFRNRPPLSGAGEDAEADGSGIHECRPTGAVVSLRC